MEAVILAGGLGTRLGELTEQTPKPMLPVNHRPFLEYLLDYWAAQGIRRFILSTGYKNEVIKSHFGSRYKNSQIDYSVEEMPLGTGGGLMQAAQMLECPGPFLLLNGDTFFEVSLKSLYRFFEEKKADMSFSLFACNAPYKRYEGIVLDLDARVKGIVARDEHKNSDALVNGGVYLIDSAWIKKQGYAAGTKISLENKLIPDWISGGKNIFGYTASGRFMDIGTVEDYGRAGVFFDALINEHK